MSMSQMYKDRISLIKNDGTRVDNIKCSVQTNTIFVNMFDTPIEPKDIIIRQMSNGAEETFLVIDPNFFEEIHGIKAHYQMTVKKLGLSCRYPGTFNSALHAIITSKSYKSAILKTIRAGGCNCSRSNFVGSYFSALKGRSSIPVKWVNKCIHSNFIINSSK